MKPLIFRVRPGSNYELNDSDQLYIVDFLLDCTTAMVLIRDTICIHDYQKGKSQFVLNKLALLLYTITTDPVYRGRAKVRVEPRRILTMMIDQLSAFPEDQQEQIIKAFKDNLKEYL